MYEYSHLTAATKGRIARKTLHLPVISVVNLLVGIVSLSDAFLRCRIDESKSVHSTKFDDSSILQQYATQKSTYFLSIDTVKY